MEKGFILSLIFAGIVGVFALKNGDRVLIDLFFTKIQISQAIVIFLSAFLGAIIVSFLGTVRRFKFNREIKDLNKVIEEREEENLQLLEQLRNKEELIKHKEEQIKSLYNENLGNRLKD